MTKSIHIEIGESYAGLKVRIGNVNGAIEYSNIPAEEVLDDIRKEIREVFGVSGKDDRDGLASIIGNSEQLMSSSSESTSEQFQKTVEEVKRNCCTCTILPHSESNHYCPENLVSATTGNTKQQVENLIELAVRKAFELKCMGTCDSFLQAEMIIDDIKRITGCNSDDGVEIVESVENLKKEATQKIIEEVESEDFDGLYDIFNDFILMDLIGEYRDVPMSSSDAIDLQNKVKSYFINKLKSRLGSELGEAKGQTIINKPSEKQEPLKEEK